jgi:MFS family permease
VRLNFPSHILFDNLTCLSIGGIPPYIYGDLGGSDRWVWFVLANLLALAAVCPFVGALSDLIGRRYVAITGASFIILGMIISSTAHTMNTFICRSMAPPRV